MAKVRSTRKRSASTERLLEKIRQHQMELRLSNEELARTIGVTSITLHNWRCGKTRNITAKNQRKAQNFLNMHSKADDNCTDQTDNKLVQQARKICQLCAEYPHARQYLLDEMNTIIRETLGLMVSDTLKNNCLQLN